MSGTIVKVSGPLVVAAGLGEAKLAEAVRVGPQGLLGEIVSLAGDTVTIEVFEETGGLGPGAEVVATGAPFSVELGPGLLGNLYDGIQRPLEELYALTGDTIAGGLTVSALNRAQRWAFQPTVTVGSRVAPGDVIGTARETEAILHKIMVPPGVEGSVAEVHSGERTVEETVVIVRDKIGAQHKLSMIQRWPVRMGRPYRARTMPTAPLRTGQETIDTRFPLAKGGTVAVAGPSGREKTALLHDIARAADVDVAVYIGCGTRGNERLNLPPERTVRVVHAADAPPAARTAAIDTGLTIAEYYRDMGYDVLVIADAMGFHARPAACYGRAGAVECLGSGSRRGSLTVIGSVSSPRQATMRLVRAFWALDADGLDGYSLYAEGLGRANDD